MHICSEAHQIDPDRSLWRSIILENCLYCFGNTRFLKIRYYAFRRCVAQVIGQNLKNRLYSNSFGVEFDTLYQEKPVIKIEFRICGHYRARNTVEVALRSFGNFSNILNLLNQPLI